MQLQIHFNFKEKGDIVFYKECGIKKEQVRAPRNGNMQKKAVTHLECNTHPHHVPSSSPSIDQNKLAKLRRIHFAKIHFTKIHFAKIHFAKMHFGNGCLKAVGHSFQKIYHVPWSTDDL